MNLFLGEPFKSAWRNQDPFEQALAISHAAGQQNIFGARLYRNKEGRRTLQFDFEGRSYFLKYHEGIGWKEIIKNLLQLRAPILSASNEYRAAQQLARLGVDTLTPVAYGCRGNNPARQHSFLITNNLVNTISLEDYCHHWPLSPPPFRHKLALINKVARAAKIMHSSGINHRDFYVCHFLLNSGELEQAMMKPTSASKIDEPDFHCYLIDLHRCQFRKQVPYRWQVKDLGGLLYSTFDTGLTARDYFRFIKIYSGKSLRESLRDSLWRDTLANAEKLYQKDFGKAARKIFK